MPIVTVQTYLSSLLNGLDMPYGQPAAQAYVTPPDPRVQARVPAIYVWPSNGDENRSAELGGTVPRNSGPGTPSGTKGIMHRMDVYLTWTSANNGRQADPVFPGMIDAVMGALRYSQPNPVQLTDPNDGLTTTVYNVGEDMHYQPGLEALDDERWLRYDCLVTVSVWEIMRALSAFADVLRQKHTWRCMALGGPNIYPGVLTWLGIARELTAGQPVTPTYTHPLDQGSFEPEDTPKFLQDKAIRGSMTDLFYETLGVESAMFSFGGPNFLDTHGYFFDNVFGDLSTTAGTITTSTLYTVSTGATVGSTSVTFGAAPTGFTAGTMLQIGTALTTNTPSSYANELVIVTSTAASNVVNFAQPLRFTHPTTINGTAATGSSIACVVPATTASFTHRFAALNSQLGYGGAYGAQPPTHTFTDVTNIVNVMTSAGYGTAPSNIYGARYYGFSCVKQLDFSGNAEQLLGIKMSGDSFLSAPWGSGTAPVLTTTNSRPVPNWRSTVTILDQGTVPTIGEFNVSFKRQTTVYWTVQGSQQPFVIARGPLTMDGTIQYDPTNSELPLDLMLLNAQGPMTITCTNAGIPNAGTPFTLTFQASQTANVKSKIARSKVLVGFGNSYEGVGNAQDVGGSGGLGPGVITLVNNIPTY